MTLSPTSRTRLIRNRDQADTDRAALHRVLDAGVVAHLGIDIDAAPRVLPTVYAYDLDGPDRDGTLYVHGSVASRSLVDAPDTTVCVTVTVIDGLVLARSGFHHSMNYRCALVLGTPRVVTDPWERDRALDLIVDHVVPGRAATLRAPTRKELAATRVLALALHEASVKHSTGGPDDEDVDIEADETWAGVVPLRIAYDEPVRSADCGARHGVPEHVRVLGEQR